MHWFVWIAIVLIGFVGFLFWQNLKMPKTTGLMEGQLQPCPKSPNCVCSSDEDGQHYIAPLPFASEKTLGQIQAFLSNNYIAQVVEITPTYLHVVVTTPVLRFKDDLEFQVDRQKGEVQVRSGARVGSKDFGVNRARIEKLRAFLKNT